MLCREDGGVLDDLFTYRVQGERYLTVTNAANHARDLQMRDEAAHEHQVGRAGPVHLIRDGDVPAAGVPDGRLGGHVHVRL